MRAVAALLLFFAKSYQVDGIIVAVDPAARTMLVSHRSIGRYMPAMMMPFRVDDPSQLTGLYPGMRVEFDLVVNKDRSFARNIRKTGGDDVKIPTPKDQLHVGDEVADFRLLDQDSHEVRLSEFRGKIVAIDFLYTRCPLPDVCPRLAATFATLQRRFAGSDVVLLSITVDPDYDSPAVLAAYAKRWGADPTRWRFLTGDVARVAAQLGEVYWTDEGSIGHNSTTSIIGRDGRLKAVVEGSGYRVDQLADLITRELEGK